MTAAFPLPAEASEQQADSSGALAARDASDVAHVRSELLAAFLEQLSVSQIPYCLLNGFQGYPDVIPSDVDFMVLPKDAGRIAPLLQDVARRCGGSLVQAMRHETGACYFVVAKQAGGAVAYVHPDCTTDYRREGRLWLEAEAVVGKRQVFRSFLVPAIADEFLYYLIKKVLKQRISNAQRQRITSLYLGCPEECDERIRRLWSEETARELVAAIVRRETVWIQSHLPALLSELRQSQPVEGWWKRVQQQAREWRLRLERAASPTGLSVAVCGGTEQQREELAAALEKNLRPAFRRTTICGEDATRVRLRSAAKSWLAKVRSTLVIRKRAAAEAEWLMPDEISFLLAEETGERSNSGSCKRCVVLDSGWSRERKLEQATRCTLEYMAARLLRRMKLYGASSLATRSVE